jgi:hypothetical protein
MSDPHAGSQTFAADVSQAKSETIVNFVYGDKVTSHMANGESFTGNFEVMLPHQPRRAQAPVNLRGFNQLRV